MISNLPDEQKENWALNEIVMPANTNSWGSAINKLSTAVPVYASTGDFYTVQSYNNNVISLAPLSYLDGTQNETPLSYLDGMNVVFKSNFNNQNNCSVNVNGLGIKQIKNINNTLLNAEIIKQGYYVSLKYDLLQNCFYLINISENFQKISEKGQPNGYAPLDDKGFLPPNYTPNLANKDLSNLNTAGNAHFANPSLSNLNTAGNAHFANPSLSNLSDAGNAKLNQYVKKSGDTMTGDLWISAAHDPESATSIRLKRTNVTLGSKPASKFNVGGMFVYDKDNNIMAIIQGYIETNGTNGLQLITRKPDNSEWGASIYLSTDFDGNQYCLFPKCTTKATTTSSARGDNVAVVVQNYVNGTSWYRVWSDGWIEQGGSIIATDDHNSRTITFIKPFSNTNYTVVFSKGGWNDGYSRSDSGITATTTTSFTIGLTAGSRGTYGRWFACGY